ncbi:hypothetical protein NBRC116601_25420 [Cognatishimia sp. WU-CL00825]|uniref:hypothetical protein n=1 Tax=Cognatishimia sp. WU-CL00825 TaxID=3127658 RepID=UPI003106E3C2
MKLLPYAAVMIMGGLSLASVATSATLERGHRPTQEISVDLTVPEQVFKRCFENVRPAPDHQPNGDRQRTNKAQLLPCLQTENPAITNELLDRVMDKYRPEGPIKS